MRHDIDRGCKNALKISKIESNLDIKASYYFRTIKKFYDERAIRKIGTLGHEIGYHYEELSLTKGNFEHAIAMFKENLRIFRQIFPR